MSASTRITYDISKLGGGLTQQFVADIMDALEKGVAIQALMTSVTAAGTTQTNLEGSAEFGVAAGQGAAFYSAVNYFVTQLQGIAGVGNMYQG
jgi:hypothetical protein